MKYYWCPTCGIGYDADKLPLTTDSLWLDTEIHEESWLDTRCPECEAELDEAMLCDSCGEIMPEIAGIFAGDRMCAACVAIVKEDLPGYHTCPECKALVPRWCIYDNSCINCVRPVTTKPSSEGGN